MDELIAAASQLVLETARARDIDFTASPDNYTRAESFGPCVPKANRKSFPCPPGNKSTVAGNH
jgi:hypothetical protein